METIFYKILYKEKEVVYVGVTTRTLKKRFREHVVTKFLNKNDFSIVEIDRIKHPEITSIEVFYEEYKKVANLERKYIREELEKGSHLLNIRAGGEWGSYILNKLKDSENINTFGSFDKYKAYKKMLEKIKMWVFTWVRSETESKTKIWIKHWIHTKTRNSVKLWVNDWIYVKTRNSVKLWVNDWIYVKTRDKVKVWVRHWIHVESRDKISLWVRQWIHQKLRNKTKKWLYHWINRMKGK